MAPETLVVSLLTAAVTKEAAGRLLEHLAQVVAKEAGIDLTKAVRAKVQSVLKKWSTKKGLDQLCDRGKQIRKVKTLWQVEREIDLVKFYYPSKVKSATEPAREVHQLSDFPFDGNLVIRGTVGQGKSIFLRYLAARELALGERIPVFMELRRLGPSVSLEHDIVDELKNLGLSDADRETVDFLAQSGRLLLLFDGFDELPDSEVTRVTKELESLAVRFVQLRMIVTSRPETAIQHSPHFRVFDLAPLVPGEFAKVVGRIVHPPALAEEIVNGVNRGHQSIAGLLSTPLMVALLVVHYRVGQGVPENRVAFFEPIFMVLLQRHDKAKAGYRRARHSDLADSELLQFFNCLCFVTRRDRVSVVKSHALIGAANKALAWLKLAAKPDHAVDDIRRITCLILREGEEYRFLHKSVQEFHAACFVRDQPETVAREFYRSMLGKWDEWQQELLFLETIDAYRYNRFFAIPMLEQVMATLPGALPSDLGKALIGRLNVRVAVGPRPEFLNTTYPTDHLGWCLINYFDGSSDLLERIAAAALKIATSESGAHSRVSEAREFALQKVLPEVGLDHPLLLDASEKLGRHIAKSLDDRRAAVHGVEERKGLLEL